MRSAQPGIKNQRGAAILLAVFSLALMVFLAVDVAYDTQVEYVAATQSVNRLKAYYAAKAGVEFSLLRITLYKKAMAGLAPSLGDQAQTLLNPIWQMPFMWPPQPPDGMNVVHRDRLQTTINESMMDAQFLTTIEGEGGKIDINDLASPNEEYAKKIHDQLLQIFANEIESNEQFAALYRSYNFDELLGNIADWIDEDSDGRSGRHESDLYSDRDTGNAQLPPNQPFKTLQELHMVAGMEDEIFKVLAPRITVYGTKGININTASTDLIRALDPRQFTDHVIAEINKRRSDPTLGGPFRDDADFFSFLRSHGVRTDELENLEMPLLYDAEYNFRIVSSGTFGHSRREITVITYDVENLTDKMVELLKPVNPSGGGTPTPSPTPGGTGNTQTKKTYKSPKGAPTVVYWQET